MTSVQISGVRRYKLCVARNASKVLGISVTEVEHIMHVSGINSIIDADPTVSLHYDPDDWIENVQAYILRASR